MRILFAVIPLMIACQTSPKPDRAWWSEKTYVDGKLVSERPYRFQKMDEKGEVLFDSTLAGESGAVTDRFLNGRLVREDFYQKGHLSRMILQYDEDGNIMYVITKEDSIENRAEYVIKEYLPNTRRPKTMVIQMSKKVLYEIYSEYKDTTLITRSTFSITETPMRRLARNQKWQYDDSGQLITVLDKDFTYQKYDSTYNQYFQDSTIQTRFERFESEEYTLQTRITLIYRDSVLYKQKMWATGNQLMIREIHFGEWPVTDVVPGK